VLGCGDLSSDLAAGGDGDSARDVGLEINPGIGDERRLWTSHRIGRESERRMMGSKSRERGKSRAILCLDIANLTAVYNFTCRTICLICLTYGAFSLCYHPLLQ
jgi:hypothetical protein